MLFAHGETVYVLAYLGDDVEDAHGNLVDAWAAQPGVAIPGCAFDPGSSDEPTEANRNAVTASPRLFCEPGSVISAKDRIKVRGLVYEVIGDPADWRHPMVAWNPGIEVNLRRVTG